MEDSMLKPGQVYIQQVWHSAKFRCRCLISIYPISPQSLNSVSRNLCDSMFTCRLQRSSCGLGCRPFVGILASCEFFFQNHVLSQQGANGSLAPLEISLTNRSLANWWLIEAFHFMVCSENLQTSAVSWYHVNRHVCCRFALKKMRSGL